MENLCIINSLRFNYFEMFNLCLDGIPFKPVEDTHYICATAYKSQISSILAVEKHWRTE